MFKKKPRSNSTSKGEGVPRIPPEIVPRPPPRLPDTPPPTQPPQDYYDFQRSATNLNEPARDAHGHYQQAFEREGHGHYQQPYQREGHHQQIQQAFEKDAGYVGRIQESYSTDDSKFKNMAELTKKGYQAANELADGKLTPLTDIVMSNPALQEMIRIAGRLVDVGKTIPFVSPVFSILKVIIDIEKMAREADAKCTDLLERINFMVGHLTILEKIRVMDATRIIIQKMERVLKNAASLIAAYRKQGFVARRLNMGNKDKFTLSAGEIQSCCSDLMVSLQIQTTGQLDILTRSVPVDQEDQIAQIFISQNGGPDQIKNNPELVKQFARQINVTVDESVMRELNININEMMQQNQVAIEKLLKDNMSAAIADGIKGIAAQMNDLEREEKFHCVQCGQEYRQTVNGPGSCAFHTTSDFDSMSQGYMCCGQKDPCQHRSHRSRHHCDYPYGNFFPRAYNILNYTNTVEEWAETEEKDLETNKIEQAMVGRLICWTAGGAPLKEPTIIIRVGDVTSTTPYFFDTFIPSDLDAINRKQVHPSKKSLIFRTTPDESTYAMAEWVLDSNGIITGVKTIAKVATSDTPTIHFVPIDSATCAKSGDTKLLSKGGIQIFKPDGPYILPETINVGVPIPLDPIRKPRTDFKTRSKLSIPVVLMLASDPPLRANSDRVGYEADFFYGSISVFNKAVANSNNPITIASATASFRLIGDETYTPAESLQLVDSKFPITIDPRQSSEIKFKATVPRTEHDLKLHVAWSHRAVVARKRPLRLKITFKDIEGDECSLVLEYVFSPFRPEKPKENDLAFFYMDDYERSSRFNVRVSPINETYNSKVINIEGEEYTVEDLNKLVYDAKKSGKTEIDLNLNREKGGEVCVWNAWALVDLSCQRVYAFKVLITQGKKVAKKTSACLGYVLCPEYGEATETRPVSYAAEQVGLPALEPAEAETVLEDDLVDEWVSEPEKPKEMANGMVGGAGGVFVMPEALERRLASIDENLARTATAVESLVLILAKMLEKEPELEPQVL